MAPYSCALTRGDSTTISRVEVQECRVVSSIELEAE